MKYYQIIYFVTFIFATIVALIISKIMKDVSLFDALNFCVVSYILYHLLHWKYSEEGDI